MDILSTKTQPLTLKKIFEEAACLIEMLFRLGFEQKHVSFALSDDAKCIGVGLKVEDKEVIFELADNIENIPLEELKKKWLAFVEDYHHVVETQKGRDEFGENVWKKSMAVIHIAEIVRDILNRSITIPTLKDTNVERYFLSQRGWGQA